MASTLLNRTGYLSCQGALHKTHAHALVSYYCDRQIVSLDEKENIVSLFTPRMTRSREKC